MITATVSILLAIVGVAVIALLVSNKANTGSLIGAGGSAFSRMLCTALSPITGKNCSGGVPNVTSTVTF